MLFCGDFIAKITEASIFGKDNRKIILSPIYRLSFFYEKCQAYFFPTFPLLTRIVFLPCWNDSISEKFGKKITWEKNLFSGAKTFPTGSLI
jgi:hypothetical protein